MPTPHGSYANAFAAARLLRELARDVHGNLAAIQVAPLEGPTLGDELRAVGDELNAMTLRLAELRERTATIAQAHVEANATRLKPNFGYRLVSREGVKQLTTPGANVSS